MGPLKSPVRTVDGCPVCFGSNAECATCKGTDTWDLYQCPGAMVEGWAAEVVMYARQAQEHAVYPDGGAMLDQPAWLMAAFGLVWRLHALSLDDEE